MLVQLGRVGSTGGRYRPASRCVLELSRLNSPLVLVVAQGGSGTRMRNCCVWCLDGRGSFDEV